MDGTLVDSHAVVERIWATFAQRFGLDVREILATSHGVRMIETIRRHAPDGTDIERVALELGAIELHDTDGVLPVPGAPNFVAQLPPSSIALVTSATRELARSRMTGIGIPMPEAVITAEDVEHGKPSPDCYLAAAAKLGVDPADAVVFEDAEAGILAGLAAGMRVVVVGQWRSDTTEGLPRIADFRATSAEVVGGDVRLTLR
jgi:sugar-phosphatase